MRPHTTIEARQATEVRRARHHLKVKAICLALCAVLWTASHAAFGLPEGEQVESGSVRFERPDASTLNIFADDRSVINFHSFDIAANEAVNFFQPSSSSSVLSRVSGPSASQIAGALAANGLLFLVNPNGISFAATAAVSANALIASTLDIATNNFVNGNYVLQRGSDAAYAQVINAGSISAGNVALISSSVTNSGLIVARQGSVQLACGDQVTVSFDQRGMIQVVVTAETRGILTQSGTIEASEVVMDARTAADIFEKSVNQTGIVRATGMSAEGGVIRIRSNRSVQVSGAMENTAVGRGEVTVAAAGDIQVNNDLTVTQADLTLAADSDLDGRGAFRQAAGTRIQTIGYGDIIIQAAGACFLADIVSAGDLMLRQAGSAAVFTQYSGSQVTAAGSLAIGQGVTLQAADSYYRIGANWFNLGVFVPQDSSVELISAQDALVQGSTVFNNFKVVTAGKKVTFTVGDTVTIEGILTVRGEFGNLVSLVSSVPGQQWRLLPLGAADIVYSQIGDCYHARGPPLAALHSSSLGNNTNLVLQLFWTGEGASNNWSDPCNWDCGIVPSSKDAVVFDGSTGLNPNKNSCIDSAYHGSFDSLTLDGYSGMLTLGRDISLSGNWANNGANFQAAGYQVSFVDAAKPSFISGTTTFHGFTCTTPSKYLYFEAGKITTITGTLKLQGAYASHVRLLSSISGQQWYMDPQGTRDITYTWVEDSYNLSPAIVMMYESTNRGNCYNWDPTAYWTGTISNLWSVAGNWIGLGGAAPGAGDDLVFPSGATNFSTSNDYEAGTSFNSITITADGYTLAGNAIALGAGGLTTHVAGGSTTVSLNIFLAVTRTVTVTNSDETLTISGVISGGAGVGLTKAGSGTLVLSNTNIYQGATTINAGTLNVSADANLGQAPGVATAGQLTLNGGILQATGTFVLNSNRGIALGASGGTIDVDSGMVLTYGGVIDGANALTKLDAGELVLQGINTNASTVTINGGTLTFSGANGTMASATFTVNQAGKLVLDNSTSGTNNTNRLSNTNALTLAGGEFVFKGTATAATNALETVGTLTLPSGASIVTVVAGTGGQTQLTFADISRTAGATVLFRGDSLGANPAANVANIKFTATATITSAANFIGTTSGALANDTTVNIKIIPWAFGDLTNSGSGSSFVTFNTDLNAGTNGIRPLKTTEYTANAYTAATNVRITATTNVVAASINSLLVDGGNVNYAANLTLTVTSGAVARVSGGDIAATAARTTRVLTFGTAEGVVFAIGSFNIAPRLSGSAGLTISGGGTITFPTAAGFGTTKNFTGTLTINQGGLSSALASAIPSVAVVVGPAGTLTLVNVSNTITTLTMYSGNTSGAFLETGTGVLTLGGNVTLNVNGSGATGATINSAGTGSMALGATRTITVNDGSASDDLTISLIVSGSTFGITKEGSGTLALTKANTFTGVTTLNAGTLSVVIMRNGGVASGIGASTNVATNLILNGGTFRYTGGTASTNRLFTVGTSSAVTFDASGVGVLTFTGASMTLNGTNAARTLTFTGSGSAVLTNVIPDNGTGATTVVKNGSGTWTFNGVNTYTGTTTVNAGTLSIAADSGLGTAPGSATPGYIALSGGTLKTSASFTLSANRGISLSGSCAFSQDVGTTLTYTGIIAGSGIFTKEGSGELVLQGANTYTAATVVNAGTLTLSGSAGSALNTPTVTINTDATFLLDNTAANNFDRIADIVPINMNGGYVTYTGCSSAASFETVGALNIVAGANVVSVRDSTGGATVLTFASFSRVAGSMVLFRGTNFGSAPDNNVSTIMFTAAPALTGGGGAAGTNTVSIIQGAFGSSSPTGLGTDMVTYNIADNAFGLRLLNEGGFTNEYAVDTLSVANANVKLTTSVAPTGSISINSLVLRSGGGVASSAYTLTIGSGNILAVTGNTGINGTTVLAFGANPGIIRAVDDLAISSRITGTAGLTTGGEGTITLSNAANSFTGGIRIGQGTVSIAADAHLGSSTGATAITLYNGTLRTSATFELNSSRGILLKGPGSISVDSSTTLTYNGILTGPGSLIKEGAGSLALGGANTFAGDLTVNAGTLAISAANSYRGNTVVNGTLVLSGANGALANTASVAINVGGVLTLDNSSANNTNRIADGAEIDMNGGSFDYSGSSSTNASETVGALLLAFGQNTITVTPGAGGSTVLTFANLSRNAGAMALFRGTSLGSAPAANVSTIYFDDDPVLVGGGGAAGSLTVSIIAGVFGDASLSGTGSDMVTYNLGTTNGYGLRLLAAAEYGTTFTANYNVKLTAATAPSATVTITSLIINQGGSVSSSTRTVTVTSGNILNTSNAGAITNTSVIAFGANEGIILNTSTLNILSNMTGTAGIAFGGSGTTTLSTVVKRATGMMTINAGTLVIGIANAINSAASVTIAPGATMNTANLAETVTSLIMYSGTASAGTLTSGTGTLTLLAAGGGSVILNVNGSGAVGAVITATSTGALALGASRTVTVNDGTAADDLTISRIISGTGFGITKAGAGTLVLSGNNTYTGANVINAGTLAVTVNNALGTNAAGTTVNAGTLDFRGVTYSTTEAITLATGSTLLCSAGTSSVAGAVTLAAPSTVEVSGTQLTLSGTIANGGYRLTIDGDGNTVISNTLSGTGGLAKQGLGTLTLSNTVTLGGNFSIARGTVVFGSNSVTISGNWTNNATFTCGTSTVTFNGGSSTIDSGGIGNGQAFYKVIINATGTKTLANNLMVNNVLQVDAGTLAGDYSVTVLGGSATGNGVITLTDGTFTLRGSGNFGGSSGNWTFFNLTFGDGSTTASTLKTGSNAITVSGTLAVNLNHTLQAGSSTWNLIWTTYLKNITMIASGYDHTIALTDDGYVFGWGSNVYGQLGDGTTIDANLPVQVLCGEQEGGTYLHSINSIAAGGYHSMAVASDGAVYAWGYNEYGQLGDNSTADRHAPVRVHGVDNVGNLSGINAIAANGFNSAAVSSAGFVYCWGYNGKGELGNNTTVDSLFPVQVLSGSQGGGTYLHDIVMVSVGGVHVIALTSSGYVFAWGYNGDGELGNGLTTDSHVPVQVLSGSQGGGTYLHDITMVSAGDAHCLALTGSGYVYAWGYNSDGQLGDNTTTDAHAPVQVSAGEQAIGTYLQNATEISAGAAHSLAIASGGYVFSWGQNTWGQLGNGLTADSATPVRVLSGDQGSETYLHGIADIAAGGAQTVALSQARPVFNCGNNARGQLGNGSTVGEVDQIRVMAGSQAGPQIQLVVTGTLQPQTSTFHYASLYAPHIDIAAGPYFNLTLSGGSSYWLSGTTTVSGNLLIDDSTLSADIYTLNVGGNWTNTGTFNAGSGTVVLNSATQAQSVTSGGSAFNILTVTNTYTAGVSFVDRLVTAYLNAGSGVKKLSFSSASQSQPHRVTTGFNVLGSAGNLIELAPIMASTTWYLEAPSTSTAYLKVGYSHLIGATITATNSQDNSGNTNWNITP